MLNITDFYITRNEASQFLCIRTKYEIRKTKTTEHISTKNWF